MRRSFALWLLILSLASGVTSVLVVPAALAAGSTSTTSNPLTGASSSPSFGITSGGAATTPATPTQTATTVAYPSSAGGLSSTDGIIIGVIVALVLGGIAFFIWYDARGSASGAGRREEALFGARAHAGSKTPHKQRKLKPAERKRRKRGRAR